MKSRVEGAQRQEVGLAEEAEEALALRLQEEGMNCGSDGEADAKTPTQGIRDLMAGVGPSGRAASVGEERIERSLGTLKRHRHTVAGKRRNHRVSITERDSVGDWRRWAAVERHRGNGAERVGNKVGPGEAAGEGSESGGGEVAEEQIGAFRAEFPTAKEPADIDLVGTEAGETDVGVIAEVEFEVGCKGEVTRVDF